MKSLFDHVPASFEKWGIGKTLVNFSCKEVKKEMGEESITEYEVESVIVDSEPTYPKVVEAMIREAYSVSDEIAIIRQKEEKAEEFAEYNSFVEACKAKAKPLF